MDLLLIAASTLLVSARWAAVTVVNDGHASITTSTAVPDLGSAAGGELAVPKGSDGWSIDVGEETRLISDEGGLATNGVLVAAKVGGEDALGDDLALGVDGEVDVGGGRVLHCD